MNTRKPARRMAEIPPEILSQLNRGEIAALNLVEVLAVDFSELVQHAIPGVPTSIVKSLQQCELGWLQRTRLICELLHQEYGLAIFPELVKHPSDNVRGWAAGILALSPNLNLKQRLDKVKPLADDPHSGVRETAWLLLRDDIAAEIERSIHYFKPWVQDASANIRRFAIESTRPRGVWCKHIELLKTKPELALPLLEPLKADPARYVQNSVANWLSDAAKSQPAWVKALCQQWLCHDKATQYICKRAQRNLR
jgi:3-methyladenine DNA glycosylase AlkC